jgi:hypothetical protein
MKQTLISYLRSSGIAVILAIVIGLVIGGIGWLSGWRNPVEFSDGFFIAGAVVIAIGLLSVLGGYQLRGNFTLLHSQSAGIMNRDEQTSRMVKDTADSYGALFLLSFCGILLIAVAVILGSG